MRAGKAKQGVVTRVGSVQVELRLCRFVAFHLHVEVVLQRRREAVRQRQRAHRRRVRLRDRRRPNGGNQPTGSDFFHFKSRRRTPP